MTVGLSPIVRMTGEPLGSSWQASLIEVRIDARFQVPARAMLRFSDPGYELASSSGLALGSEIEVLDPTDQRSLIKAEVVAVSCEQRPGEQPELLITALDKSHRLGRPTAIKVFQNVTYSDIVSNLAQGAGLRSNVDATEMVLDYLMQAESPLALITEAARRTGFDWWVDGETLQFKRPASLGDVEMTLGEELRSFSARAAGLQPSKVVIDGWDRDSQSLVTSSAENSEAPVAQSKFADLAKKGSRAFGTDDVLSSGLGATTQAEAGTLAQTVLDRAATAMVSAKGVLDGTGAVSLGKMAKVSGAGPLNGTYPVTEVEHIYRPATGFVTRFSSGERIPGTLVDTLGGGAIATGGPYSGPAHHRSGVTVGKVTNNNDPKNWGRVKVRYPGVSSDHESDWARIATVGGGKERGSVWIPEVDDEVLVAFEGGDARRPVVIGGLFGDTNTMPKTDISDGAVQSRAMTSRLGHVIAFLDGTSPDKQAIDLALVGNEHSIHLGKDQLSVKVPSGTPIEVTAGDASIQLTKSGDITLKGMNVTIQAESNLKLQGLEVSAQADTNLTLDGKVKAGLSGAIVEVQSQGPAKVAGTPVMIN